MKVPKNLAAQMAEKSDQELLEIAGDPHGWLPESLDAAAAELRKRNIDTSHIVRDTSRIVKPVPKTKQAVPFFGKDATNTCFWIIVFGIFLDLVAAGMICFSFSDDVDDKQSIIIGGVALLTFGSLIAYLGRFQIKRENKKLHSLSFVSSIDYNQNVSELPEKHIIRAIMLDKAIPAASISLIAWGGINLVLWFLGHQETVEQLSKIPAPSGAFTFYIYGGCVIGLAMLAFGIFGQVTKNTLVGYLDGFALIAVGIWNGFYDLGLAGDLKPYGYHIEGWQGWNYGGWTVWRVIGTIQIIWGVTQLSRFWRFGFQPRGINQAVKSVALTKLLEIVRSQVRPDIGRFKINIRNNLFEPGVTGGTYTVWLLPDKAFCLHDQLNDYFECDRRRLLKQQLTKGDHEVLINGCAFRDFNEWLRIE